MPTINGKKVATFRLVQEGKEVIFEEENEGSANTIAGTAVRCEKCNHSWEIEVNDVHPYLCNSCGWDSQQQEYDFDEFDSWQEKNGMLDEALTSTQRAQRRWAFQKNRKLINIKKDRTRIRKKAYVILYKRAYKLAYLQVRKEWTERLFGSKKYDELSLPQKKRVSEMVQRKKRKILKLARFRFLPALKQKEADRFKTNEVIRGGLSKGMSLRDIADKHGVSFEELSKEAKKGVKVEMEHTNDVKVAYEIAKDNLFEDPKYYTKLATIEELAPHGYPDQEWMDNHEKEMKSLRKQLDKQQKETYK